MPDFPSEDFQRLYEDMGSSFYGLSRKRISFFFDHALYPPILSSVVETAEDYSIMHHYYLETMVRPWAYDTNYFLFEATPHKDIFKNPPFLISARLAFEDRYSLLEERIIKDSLIKHHFGKHGKKVSLKNHHIHGLEVTFSTYEEDGLGFYEVFSNHPGFSKFRERKDIDKSFYGIGYERRILYLED